MQAVALCAHLPEGPELKGIPILAAALFMNAAFAQRTIPEEPPPAGPAVVPGSPIEVPEWLFPIDPKSLEKNPKPVKLDDVELLEIPDSKEKFTQARINDPFNHRSHSHARAKLENP